MTTVKHVLLDKISKRVWTIQANDLVYNAVKIMSDRNIGALIVLDDKEIVGLVTERDYARKIILDGKQSRNTKISEIMSTEVLYVLPDDSLEGCMAIMTEKRIRHLPVIDRGELIGLLSIGDVVRAVVSHKEFLIDQLSKYIAGEYTDSFPSLGANIANTEDNKLVNG